MPRGASGMRQKVLEFDFRGVLKTKLSIQK